MKIKHAIAAVAATVCLACVAADAAVNSAANDTSTNPDSGIYVGLNTGMSFFHMLEDDSYASGVNQIIKSPGYNIGGFAGYQFTKNWRAGLSVDYIHNSIDNNAALLFYDPTTGKYLELPIPGSASSQMHVLVNGEFDYPLKASSFIPYIGLGVGYDHVSLHSSNLVPSEAFQGLGLDSMSGFGWQLAAGVKYVLKKNLDLAISYRLIGSHATQNIPFDLEDGSTSLDSMLNSVIGVSISYLFQPHA